MINIAVLVSGRGSNLQAIINACKRKEITGKVVVVISNNENALALKIAQKEGIKTFYLKDEKSILEVLRKFSVHLIALAGYMKLISKDFISKYRYKIINIHPSLLPSFKGLDAQKQAFEYGVKVTGATVHFVDEGMDTGPIILQSPVIVKREDTLETLALRILQEEHKLYPKAIELFAQRKLKIVGRKVKILMN